MKSHGVFLLVCCVVSFSFFSCDTVLDMLGSGGGGSSSPYTNAEAVQAMRSALNIGAESASGQLSKEDAYYESPLKIPLPPEVDSALNSVKELSGLTVLGFDIGSALAGLSDDLVEKVVLGVNRSAEHAAKEVVPIFSTAITGMTVQDGIGIVAGEKNAATVYLKDKTYSQLMDLYQPKMEAVLSQDLIGEMSASDAWNALTTRFNSIVNNDAVKLAAGVAGKTVPDPITTNLSGYVTGKALDGVFVKVEEEEAKIRENPFDYASDIVKKVFGAVKSGLGL